MYLDFGVIHLSNYKMFLLQKVQRRICIGTMLCVFFYVVCILAQALYSPLSAKPHLWQSRTRTKTPSGLVGCLASILLWQGCRLWDGRSAGTILELVDSCTIGWDTMGHLVFSSFQAVGLLYVTEEVGRALLTPSLGSQAPCSLDFAPMEPDLLVEYV